jgi:hypothetical protein
MINEKKERRGFQVNIGMEHFSDLIADALHLPVGSIRVHHVADNHVWQGVKLIIEGYDESFPLLVEGCEPQNVGLEMDVIVGDGSYREVIKGLVLGVRV